MLVVPLCSGGQMRKLEAEPIYATSSRLTSAEVIEFFNRNYASIFCTGASICIMGPAASGVYYKSITSRTQRRICIRAQSEARC